MILPTRLDGQQTRAAAQPRGFLQSGAIAIGSC